MPPALGLSLMPTEDWWRANEPLFAEGLVDAVEWSVDFAFEPAVVPAWIEPLLDTYEAKRALFAHGVEGSWMSATLTEEHAAWLAQFKAALAARTYRHATEHYGFITAGDVVRGTPFPCPPSRALLDVSVERWKRLADAAGRPVGVENLAFAFSALDALAQAELVGELAVRTEGFVLLDLHNLHCQIENLGLDSEALLARLPLERVREIHLAGGSIYGGGARPFRRDTHDDLVPRSVVALLERVLPRCPSLDVVIVERTDRSLFDPAEADAHRQEFRALRETIARVHMAAQRAHRERPEDVALATYLVRDDLGAVEAAEVALLRGLRSAVEPAQLRDTLAAAAPAYADWSSSFDDTATRAGLVMARQWTSTAPREGEMAAAVFRGPAWPLDVVNLPVPRPEPGQVLIRTAAVGLCGTDRHIMEGRFEVPTPIVLGHEVVGEVVALGEGVDPLRVGDRVGVSWIQSTCGACPACARGRATRCEEPRTWIENGGGLSELVVAEATGCTVLPDGLAYELAAPMFCGGHVAMSAVRNARIEPGERLGVLGLGGIGWLAAGVALAEGIDTTVLTRTPSKVGEVVTPRGRAPVRAVEEGGLDASLDVIVSTTSHTEDLGRALSWLRPGGRLVVVGLGAAAAIDPAVLVPRELSIIGSIQGSQADLDAVLALAARGDLALPVEAFPFGVVGRALSRLCEGRVRGRAVVTF